MNIEAIWQPEIQQQIYRELLNAFSFPGTVHNLQHLAGSEHAQHAVLATLLDSASTLADTAGSLSSTEWSMLQAQPSPVEDAQFILADGMTPPRFTPSLGSLESPELGATLCISVTKISSSGTEAPLILSGPGIEAETCLHVAGLDEEWLNQRLIWNSHFPLGIDCILISPSEIAVLPRTTKIQFQPQVQ